MKDITVVYEDDPSLAVIERICQTRNDDIRIASRIPCRGNQRIRKQIIAYNSAVKYGNAYFILTDLDRKPCAPTLIQEWFGSVAIAPRLLFRVAVHEVESWVLADREGTADFLGVSIKKLPFQPDELPDPKQFLINLARKSNRQIKQALVPIDDSAIQGPGYVESMSSFIQNNWSLERALDNSPSLSRALKQFNVWRP